MTAAIGAGGMGEVYRARDTALNRDVAIKALKEALAGDADRVDRFLPSSGPDLLQEPGWTERAMLLATTFLRFAADPLGVPPNSKLQSSTKQLQDRARPQERQKR